MLHETRVRKLCLDQDKVTNKTHRRYGHYVKIRYDVVSHRRKALVHLSSGRLKLVQQENDCMSPVKGLSTMNEQRTFEYSLSHPTHKPVLTKPLPAETPSHLCGPETGQSCLLVYPRTVQDRDLSSSWPDPRPQEKMCFWLLALDWLLALYHFQ